jgi:transglutaminase-like putative cysteine protease
LPASRGSKVGSGAIGETVAVESHAWVEWLCDGTWLGFDPTNQIDIGDGRGTVFVKVEITRES